MKSQRLETGSLPWARAHVGVVSAGEADSLFTPLMKPKEGKAVQAFLYSKTAEMYRGEPMMNLSPNARQQSWQMEQGILIEEEALPWYEFTRETKVERGLFCTTDDGLAGCTPDGLVGDDGILEIKGPEPHTHVGYLLSGVIPAEYVPQVQFSLYVTGRKWIEFISYRRRFPAFVLRIERDDKIMQTIAETVAAFHEQLNSAVDKLRKMK